MIYIKQNTEVNKVDYGKLKLVPKEIFTEEITMFENKTEKQLKKELKKYLLERVYQMDGIERGQIIRRGQFTSPVKFICTNLEANLKELRYLFDKLESENFLTYDFGSLKFYDKKIKKTLPVLIVTILNY